MIDRWIYLFFHSIFIFQILDQHPLKEQYCSCRDSVCPNSTFTDSAFNNSAFNDSSTYPDVTSWFAANSTVLTTAPSNENDPELEAQPNTALLSIILTFGTFLIAYFLRIFRNSKFLGRSVSWIPFFSELLLGCGRIEENKNKLTTLYDYLVVYGAILVYRSLPFDCTFDLGDELPKLLHPLDVSFIVF